MVHFFSLFNLLIGVQAVLLSFHFALKSKNPNYRYILLAFILWGFGIIVINTYLNLNYPSFLFQTIANHTLWFIGPSFYLLMKSFNKKIKQNELVVHLAPFTIIALFTMIIDGGPLHSLVPYFCFIQIYIYTTLSLRSYFKNSADNRKYAFLLYSLSTFFLLVVCNNVIFSLEHVGILNLPKELVLNMTAILFFPVFFITFLEINNQIDLTKTKIRNVNFRIERTQALLLKVKNSFEKDRIYLNQDMNLQSLSACLNTRPEYVSQIINEHFQLSFSDYVNGFRLEEVKKRLVDPKHKSFTIHGIAQECGFGSYSRFNFVFKENVGLTPKQFRDNYFLETKTVS